MKKRILFLSLALLLVFTLNATGQVKTNKDELLTIAVQGTVNPASSIFWFPKDVLEELTVNDKIQVKARGVGLKIEGFEDVRVNKISPELLDMVRD